MSGGFIIKKFAVGDSTVIPETGTVLVQVNSAGEIEVVQSDGSKKLTGYFMEKCYLSINIARNGVATGLRIQETIKAGSLLNKTVEISGQIKLVAAATSFTNFFKLRIGGLILQFANFSCIIGTTYYNYRIVANCPTSALGYGYCNFSGGAINTTNSVGEAAAVATGAISDNSVELLIGTPTNITVTNNFSTIEVY